jgi:hypothetical protein
LPTRRALAVIAAGALALVAAAPILATTVVLLDESELVARAQTIVHGDVVSKRFVASGEGGRIYTEYHFLPRELLKGAAGPDGTVVFREWGGEINGIHYWLPGVGEFQTGDEVVAFLGAPDPRTGIGFTTGLAQGKFTVTRGAGGASVRRDLGHLVLLDRPGGAQVAGAPAGDQRDLEAFKAMIREMLKK